MSTPAEEPTGGWAASDKDSFGARLALVRQRMGWGNVKVAAFACGIPAQSWRTWERDNVRPRDYMDVVRKVVARTGCDAVWLSGVDLVPAAGLDPAAFCSEGKRYADVTPLHPLAA